MEKVLDKEICVSIFEREEEKGRTRLQEVLLKCLRLPVERYCSIRRIADSLYGFCYCNLGGMGSTLVSTGIHSLSPGERGSGVPQQDEYMA